MSQDAITALHAMRILGVDKQGLYELCTGGYLTPLHFPGGDLHAYWALPTLPGGYSWQDLMFSLSVVNSLAEFRKREAEELEVRATALLQEAVPAAASAEETTPCPFGSKGRGRRSNRLSCAKTDEELLLLRERDPQTWTVRELAEKYAPSDPASKPKSKERWITRALRRAREARSKTTPR